MKSWLIAILLPYYFRYRLFRLWDFAMSALLVFLVVPAIWALTRLGIRKRNDVPKVVFGASPLINSKYHSQALKKAGIDSITVVWNINTWITTDRDFDAILNPPPEGGSIWRRWYTRVLHHHITFVKLMWQRDVFFYYFDGDGLYLRRGGPLRWLEVPALKMLGKRIVAMPYGGDVTVAGESRELAVRYTLVKDYPFMAQPKYVDLIRRQVRHFTQRADAVISGALAGSDHVPRMDYLYGSFLAIDETQWTPHYGPPRIVGQPFRVLHTPNHRLIKGTQFLIDAVELLKAEGLNIELVLLEHVPNSDVKRIMAQCHILAEQFIYGWHGLNALEGMASGKPVLCYLREDLVRLFTLYSFGGECPIVNTPVEKIADNLRWLYHNPGECERIGRLSRAYVEKYHSLEAVGGFLKGVVDSLWSGAPFDTDTYWAQRGKVDTRTKVVSALQQRPEAAQSLQQTGTPT